MNTASVSLSSDERDRSTNEDRQAGFADRVAERVRSRAEAIGVSYSDVLKAVGASSSAVANYWTGKRPWPAEHLLTVADLLSSSVDSLLGRSGQGDLLDASAADWVEVPEYDLRELTDEGRGPVISKTPMRRDWLSRTFGQTASLWLARLPADLPRFDLREGDQVFLRDVNPDEAQHGAVYIVRIWGHLTVARIDALLMAQMNSVERNLEDRQLAPRDVGTEEGKALLVARVLGAPLRRL